MNAPANPPARQRLHWTFYPGVGTLALFAASIIGIASLFFLQHDATLLRDEIQASRGGAALNTRVQFSIGSFSTFCARNAVRLLSPLEKEPLLALSTVRAVSVGVYEMDQANDTAFTPIDLEALDARMSRRGWARCTTVLKAKETVLIYVPSDFDSASDSLRLCLAVCNGKDLVVVSARGSLAPLLELARLQAASLKPAARG
jgi:hypothetical protein